MPPILGIENAVNCLDYLKDEIHIAEHTIIVGGGLVGCEIAYDLLKNNHKVTIIEGKENILNGPVPAINKKFLLDAFEYYHGNIITNVMVTQIDKNGVHYKKDEQEQFIEANTTVISVGFKSLPSMARSLYGKGIEVYEIGDGKQVGDIYTSIGSAYEIAREI